jgi:signal transduction histidine kinase
VASAVEDVADIASEGEVAIDTAVPEALLLNADRDGIRIVIRNLLHNAVKASPAGAAVHVRASQENGTVTLQVSDEGAGFPPEESARIFDKFYRIDREERGRMQGTGLGLYLVRRHVELDLGTVTAASDGPGRGATFTVRWPAGGSTR